MESWGPHLSGDEALSGIGSVDVHGVRTRYRVTGPARRADGAPGGSATTTVGCGGGDASSADAPAVGAGQRVDPASASGTPVVVLHGIGRSLRDWDEFHDLLPDRVVYGIDLAGHGGTDPLPHRHGLVPLAAHVVATLDALGIERCHLVGNSLGGAVAMEVTARAPERVVDLVLLDSAGFGRTVTAGFRVLALPGMQRLILRPHPRRSRLSERGLFHDRSLASEERIARNLALAGRDHARQVMAETALDLGTIRGVAPQWRADLLRRLRERPRPTLVVWGERDLVLPAKHLRSVADALPHARTRLLPDTGHLPQVERPVEVVALARELWRDSEGDAPVTS